MAMFRLTHVCRNIWGPDLQPKIINVIADLYEVSSRLRAILTTAPSRKEEEKPRTSEHGLPEIGKAKTFPKNDLEANGAAEKPKAASTPEEANHYTIASRLINYQSLDLGRKCMISCLEGHSDSY